MGVDHNRRMTRPPALDGATRLDHCGLIRARGADAAAFLHGQLTQDFQKLDASEARLAGYCSPKGRLLASFIGWKPAVDEIQLVCSADLLAPTLKRLSMFVLRAQCRLSDASAEVELLGLAGDSALRWLGDAAPSVTWGRATHGDATIVRLPTGRGGPRFLWSAPLGAAKPELPALDPRAWRWGEVDSGVARIEAATVDQFVPQMLNFEVVGGVDFGKGCYPGQEVVARSQYRGTTKRRAQLYTCPEPASAGMEVFHSEDPGQPAGRVVNAAGLLEGNGALLLVEVKLASMTSGSLHLGTPQGPVLALSPLPYELSSASSD